MLMDIARIVIRVALIIGIVALAIAAFWVLLTGIAIFLVGGFIYSKLTGKKMFHRTSYGNVRVIHFSSNRTHSSGNHSAYKNDMSKPPLIRDAVEVIDADHQE